MEPRGRERHRWANREVEWAGARDSISIELHWSFSGSTDRTAMLTPTLEKTFSTIPGVDDDKPKQIAPRLICNSAFSPPFDGYHPRSIYHCVRFEPSILLGMPRSQRDSTTAAKLSPHGPAQSKPNGMIKNRRSAVQYLRSEKPKFVILIGSSARKSRKLDSDIDIVRIEYHKAVPSNLKKPKQAEVSYIDYDANKFSELYRDGSLFLYHIFTEGELLRGNRSSWNALKRHFRVSTDFRKEIIENRKFLRWLQRGEKFRGATIPYLAYTFRALKNLAIFLLAQNRDFVFEKRTALQRAFPRLDQKTITVLIDANNSFERGSKLPSSYDVGPNTVMYVRKEIADAVPYSQTCR